MCWRGWRACPGESAQTCSSTSTRPLRGVVSIRRRSSSDRTDHSAHTPRFRLVPFGEYVPLRPLLGWITRHTKAAAQDRRRGSHPVVLHAGSLALGPLISFEATFSDLPRREVQLGAQLLAYQSSTSTFQGSWAQPQLASQVAVHAVEVGRPGVHAGLSGDSSAFDARGRQLAWCPSTYRGVIVVSVPLGSVDNRVPAGGGLGCGAGVFDPRRCRYCGDRSRYMAAPTPSLQRCIPRWSTSLAGREVRSAVTTTDVPAPSGGFPVSEGRGVHDEQVAGGASREVEDGQGS